MTPAQQAQIQSVCKRWESLASLSPAAKIVALRAEGWAEGAIQKVVEEMTQ